MLCKKILRYGFIFCVVFGTLFHFAYEASGFSLIVAPFVPTSESVWEHLKLVYFPFLLYAIVVLVKYEYVFPNILTAFAIGTITAMLSVVTIFYTYTGIIGHHILWIDIATLYLAIYIGYKVIAALMCGEERPGPLGSNTLGCFIYLFLITIFTTFTIYLPALPIFFA